MRPIRILSVLVVATWAVVATGPAAAVEQDAQALLARARQVLGFESLGGLLIHFRAVLADQQNYQSDRTYPPFFDAMIATENWFQPQTGIERVASQTTFPGVVTPASTSIYDGTGGVSIRNDRAVPIARSQLRTRNLNAWAVIYDWSHADDVRVVSGEPYRDYPRVVLARRTKEGEQRLFLDPKTGFPIKLDYTEPHYLWGQRRIEYVYSNWKKQNDIQINTTAFRLADGVVEISATTGAINRVAASASPSLEMPAVAAPPDAVPPFLQPKAPEIVRVGPATFLLSNPGYTEAVTRAGDEIYLFDATQGETRGRLDAEAIATAFPGKHKINLVVTDLAWPHVAGVRYWIAQGATIIAHKAARSFLQRVVERRWTLEPDLLERQRKTVTFNFRGIDGTLHVADGAVVLTPIDGIGSEVALIAYVPGDRFLWASDYIQDVSEPTAYASEVWSAAQRAGFQPQQTAAQHLKLTPWSVIAALQRGAGK